MKKKFIFCGISLIFLITFLLFLILLNIKINTFKTNYEEIDLTNIDKLMVVAHPDDEILWGGFKLIQGDYLVVCVTCGKSNPSRVKEFESVMNMTGDSYVLLDYPDKTYGKRDNWRTVEKSIITDLKNIYELKDWKEIITHNPDGEYGHIHHKMINKYMTDIVDKNKLFYFGKYYSKKTLKEKNITLPLMNDQLLDKKKKILSLYVSQSSTIDSFSHMIGTEEPLTYKEWIERYK